MASPRMIRLALLVAPVSFGSAALGAFTNGLVQDSVDPSGWTFANLVASFDAQFDGGYNYPSNAGHTLFGQIGLVTVELDRTDVRSEVYRFNQAHSFAGAAAPINVNAGDMAFVYRVRLVGTSDETVNSLTEAQIAGIPVIGWGQDVMDASLLLGQGFVNGAFNPPAAGGLDVTGTFGSSLEFTWPGSDVTNLDNNQDAVLVVFTSPAAIGRGVLNLFVPPGQSSGSPSLLQGVDAPPILIPIIPSPGSLALGALAVGFLSTGRRRR